MLPIAMVQPPLVSSQRGSKARAPRWRAFDTSAPKPRERGALTDARLFPRHAQRIALDDDRNSPILT
jgi:hypothetical protein